MAKFQLEADIQTLKGIYTIDITHSSDYKYINTGNKFMAFFWHHCVTERALGPA